MSTTPRIRRASEPALPRTTSVPADLLTQSGRRVAIASGFFALGWGLALGIHYLMVWLGLHPEIGGSPAWPQPGLTVTTSALLLSVGMVVLAGRMRGRPALLLDIGLGFEVVTAVLIGFMNQWAPGPATGQISWICAIILVYPAIAPATTARALVASLVAASMDPLWYGIAIARHVVPDASAGEFLYRFWPNYLCAIAAVVPTRIIRGLGHQVSRARELGSYRLGARLGAGGMGEVFQAEHRMLARPAAIKIIRPDLLAAVTTNQASLHIERFRREAEAAALLRSPHTIELYDFGFSNDGGFYYVMELLDGLSFEDLVERAGPVPAERAVYLMLQACESLGEAHARGLIHRDLKPANLFICRVGVQVDFVKVLDFGLVKGVAVGDPSLTAPNVAAGTPAFMAPEVALGEEADSRVDVYSLGCVLYWLLTGQLVFAGRSPGRLMHLHIQEPPAPPSERSELPIPPEVDALVLSCLAKNAEDRPADGTALRERLAALELAEEWTRARAERWWDTHRPRTLERTGPCDGEQIVPALPST
jgi:tRNA A-37 threonylcarbamoyl transferase component Bud32